MNSLVIVNHKAGTFDSDIYSDFYNFELPCDSNEWIDNLTSIVDFMATEGINDILINSDNLLYGVFGLIFNNIYSSYEIPPINVYIIPERYHDLIANNTVKVEQYYYLIDYKKPRLYHYQVHLTDVCNLKCKGCGHYCNLTEEHNFIDKEKYEKDILKIKEKFWGVERIQLLGGEPLLNPEVNEIVDITREIFPDADIRVTTNGLLLPKMESKFWNSIKANDAHIEISLYEPTRERWDIIQGSIVANGAQKNIIVWEQKEEFFKARVLEKNPNYVAAFNNCLSNKCYFLRDGKLYLCPVVFLNKFFYEKMNLEMPYEPEGIDLYDDNLDGWEIEKRLKKPCVGCYYCSEKLEWFNWEVRSKDKARVEDWIVD